MGELSNHRGGDTDAAAAALQSRYWSDVSRYTTILGDRASVLQENKVLGIRSVARGSSWDADPELGTERACWVQTSRDYGVTRRDDAPVVVTLGDTRAGNRLYSYQPDSRDLRIIEVDDTALPTITEVKQPPQPDTPLPKRERAGDELDLYNLRGALAAGANIRIRVVPPDEVK